MGRLFFWIRRDACWPAYRRLHRVKSAGSLVLAPAHHSAWERALHDRRTAAQRRGQHTTEAQSSQLLEGRLDEEEPSYPLASAPLDAADRRCRLLELR